MDNHRIQPLLYHIKHRSGRFRLGFGIAAEHFLFRKIRYFLHNPKASVFRNGMDRAHVNQTFYMLFQTQPGYCLRSIHIHIIDQRGYLIGNINHSRRMNNINLHSLQTFKKGKKRLFFPYIPFIIGDIFKLPLLLSRQYQSPHLTVFICKHTDNRVPKMSVRARDDIHFLHGEPPNPE